MDILQRNLDDAPDSEPIDIAALKALFESDLFAFVSMVAGLESSQAKRVAGVMRNYHAQGSDEFFREGAHIISMAGVSTGFMSPFDIAAHYAVESLKKTKDSVKRLAYVKTIAECTGASGASTVAQALQYVQERSLQEHLVNALIRIGSLEPITKAAELLVDDPDFKERLTAAVLEGTGVWVGPSAVRLLALEKKSTREKVLEQLADLKASPSRATRVRLVEKLVSHNDPQYAVQALEHVEDLDLQDKLVCVVESLASHTSALLGLKTITDAQLRARLITVITTAPGGSDSAVHAVRNPIYTKTPQEYDRLLEGIIVVEKIIDQLCRTSAQHDRAILVGSLVRLQAVGSVVEAFKLVKEPELLLELVSILAAQNAHWQANLAFSYTRDPQVRQSLIDVMVNAPNGSGSAARILWDVKDPVQRRNLIESIVDPAAAVSVLSHVNDPLENNVLIKAIVKGDNPKCAKEAIAKLAKLSDGIKVPLVAVIVKNAAHAEAAEVLSSGYVRDAALVQQLITTIATAPRSSRSCVTALGKVTDPTQRMELISSVTNPHAAAHVLPKVASDQERDILTARVATGNRNSARAVALKSLAVMPDFDTSYQRIQESVVPASEQVRQLTQELVADDLEEPELRELCTELFRELMNLASQGRELKGGSAYTQHGEAIEPQMAARCVLDIHRTRAFLRGAKMAIDRALEKFPGEEIIVLDPTAGPLGALNVTMALLFKDMPVKFIALDAVDANVAYHQKVIKGLGIQDSYKTVQIKDAITCRLAEVVPGCPAPHVVIIEAMMQALLQEPQVAIMTNLKNQVHPEAEWVPHDIEIYPVYFAQKAEREKKTPVAGQRLGNVATLREILNFTNGDVRRCARYTVSGSVELPPEITDDAELHLGTDVVVYPGLVLPTGMSDISACFMLDRKLQGVCRVGFQYPIGRQKNDIEVCRVDANGREVRRRPWVEHHEMMGWGGGVSYEFRDVQTR